MTAHSQGSREQTRAICGDCKTQFNVQRLYCETLFTRYRSAALIVTVGNTKGGVGKTTIAINLAIMRAAAGRDVLLIDGDEQGSAILFSELRAAKLGEAGYTAVQLVGGALRTQVRQLRHKYADIVVDVGGRDSGSLRAALTVSDVVLIPVQPRTFDVWALSQVAALLREAREVNPELRALAFLSAADAQGSDNAEALEAILQVGGIEALDAMIGRRKAFPNAAAQGLGVAEVKPMNARAIEELAALSAIAFR